MSDPEKFLSRWSRRKLEAEQMEEPRADQAADVPEAASAPENAPENALTSGSADGRNVAGKSDPAKDEEPPFDISSLPSLESITAETDIKMFLQKGVPADLTRAALRRAWTADPNIRDFIEMAENQWDFATGKDLPGFGALDASADDIRRMVAEVFGGNPKPAPEAAAETAPSKAEPPAETAESETAGLAAEPSQVQEIAGPGKEQTPPDSAPADGAQDVVQRNKVNIAMQQNNRGSEYQPLPARRPHGRALPE